MDECVVIRWITLNPKSRHDANFVINDGTEHCRHDNLRFHQWWQNWYHHKLSPFIAGELIKENTDLVTAR